MARRSKKQPSEASKPKEGVAGLYPHELRAGDIITDENGDEWELVGQPVKVVGAQDFTTTIRRVDRPIDTREGRWRAHERVRVRQPK
jgi:hypothetical protein